MVAVLLANLVRFAVPVGFLAWSLKDPAVAGYVFAAAAAVFAGYLFFADRTGRPEPDPTAWGLEEIEVLRKYHLAIKYPLGSKRFSFFLNGFRWSCLAWVSWLLWNRLWAPSAFLAAYFFLTAALSSRLDPYYYLTDGANRGRPGSAEELATLQRVRKKLLQGTV